MFLGTFENLLLLEKLKEKLNLFMSIIALFSSNKIKKKP